MRIDVTQGSQSTSAVEVEAWKKAQEVRQRVDAAAAALRAADGRPEVDLDDRPGHVRIDVDASYGPRLDPVDIHLGSSGKVARALYGHATFDTAGKPVDVSVDCRDEQGTGDPWRLTFQDRPGASGLAGLLGGSHPTVTWREAHAGFYSWSPEYTRTVKTDLVTGHTWFSETDRAGTVLERINPARGLGMGLLAATLGGVAAAACLPWPVGLVVGGLGGALLGANAEESLHQGAPHYGRGALLGALAGAAAMAAPGALGLAGVAASFGTGVAYGSIM